MRAEELRGKSDAEFFFGRPAVVIPNVQATLIFHGVTAGAYAVTILRAGYGPESKMIRPQGFLVHR